MTFTWQQAAVRWLDETQHKRSRRDDVRILKWLAEYWAGLRLDEITADVVRSIGKLKRMEVSSATVNRYLALIRAILRRAHREWEWIDKVPFVRLYSEPRRRVRWLDATAARNLLDLLPDHTRQAAIFALSTGLRHGNVVGLEWSQIDLRRRVCWLYADQVKNGEDLSIPLNESALLVLKMRKGLHSKYVFTYRGKPIKRVTTKAWYKALKQAGIKDFRWHDLRHTWASWLVQEGVPLYALQELGGWKTAAMVRRYAHLSPAQNLAYSCKIDQHLL